MQELEITVTFKVKGSATQLIPAKIDGPPESCYPEEGGELEWVYENWDTFNRAVESAIWEALNEQAY